MASRILQKADVKRLDSISIVVVDDQAQMREIVRSMLRRNGYSNVVVLEDGHQAVGMLDAQKVGLVLTDWNMPHMCGIELVRWIKTNPELFRIPVLMISDEISTDKVLYAVEEGVDGFLVKPFSEKKLVSYMDAALSKLKSSSELSEKVYEMRKLKLSGKYREALELGNEILKIQELPQVAMMACECYYHTKEFDKAIDMMLDTDEELRTSEYNNLLGKLYMGKGEQKKGIMYLEQAVARNPLNQDRKLDLVLGYFSIGFAADAERIVAALTESNPTDMVLVKIAQIFLDRGEVDRAGSYLEKTVQPIPETVCVFNNYAVALRKYGRYEESVAIYQRCLKITPNSDVVHYNLGSLYSKIGRSEEAEKILLQALSLNPGNEHARRLLEMVRESLQ